METWRVVDFVPGFEGLYEISDLGRVRSSYGVLKIKRLRQGYPYVSFKSHGKRKSIRIHRLVAIAFHPNPENLPHVNHKDHDKSNNAKTNLEWCTSKHNENDKIEHLRAIGKYKRPHAKLSKEKIAQAQVMRSGGMLLREIGDELGVSRSAVGYALNGDTWKGDHP